jgi:hypothetical protein
MTIEEIKKRIAGISKCQGDSEVAHGMEDDLHRDVLFAIATNTIEGDASECARLALTTQKISFSRWCA